MESIDNLTPGQVKQVLEVFGKKDGDKKDHPMIGKFCIARCYAAGVHAGTVESVDGENVILKDSRRLWSWKAADGIALSGVAQHGVKSNECKIDTLNPEIYLTGVCELIPCTRQSKDSINA